MVRVFRLSPLLLATAIAFTSCSGAGSTTSVTTAPATCPPGVALYALFQDPMTQPPSGATGVSTTIGSITVPQMDHVLGASLQLNAPTGGPLNGGTFVASGSNLTASVPQLQPNTVYHATAVGVPCGPYLDFGQFTTGAS